jgi:hypothetical protein
MNQHCPRCNGNLLLEDRELHCFQCGRVVPSTPPPLDDIKLKGKPRQRGGKARMANMTPEQRTEFAKQGAQVKHRSPPV